MVSVIEKQLLQVSHLSALASAEETTGRWRIINRIFSLVSCRRPAQLTFKQSTMLSASVAGRASSPMAKVSRLFLSRWISVSKPFKSKGEKSKDDL